MSGDAGEVLIETRPGVIRFSPQPGAMPKQILEIDTDGDSWLIITTPGVYSSNGEWSVCNQIVRYPLRGKPSMGYEIIDAAS